MRDVLLIMSGWLAAATFGTTLVVPWGVKALRIYGPPQRRFMALHWLLGVVVLLVGLAHGIVPLTGAGLATLRKPGLFLGLLAVLLLLAQAGLGISLRGAKATRRPQLRGAHLAMMLALAGLIAVHIVVIRG